MKQAQSDISSIVKIINVFLVASLFFYGYYLFFTHEGMQLVFRNWDGPGYVVVARTLYDVSLINTVNPFPYLAPTHYAYQFPLYPLFIRLFSFIGYNESMIFVSQLFGLLFSIALYFLVKTVNPKANALAVALVSVFYPARWFIVDHVGSTEPMVLFFMTLFMLFSFRKQYGLAALFVALAQLTKPQGIVFFAGITVWFLWTALTRKQRVLQVVRSFIPFLLVPIALLIVFTLYWIKFGNFFVFFGNEALPRMQWPPMKMLIANEIMGIPLGFWTGWLEFIAYNYILYLLGIILLFDMALPFFGIVALTYFIPVLFFVQANVARIILPILPFVYLGYSNILSKKPVFLTLMLAIPTVLLFATAYINYNLAEYPATLFIR